MMRPALLMPIMTLLLISGATAVVLDKDWTPLFDGKTLDG